MRSRSGSGHLRQVVRRRQEQHLRKVVVDLEVVIVECLVLLGIQHLEQRRRRIPAIVGAELVDLVEQDHRVHDFGATHRLDDTSGHRPDVRAAMAANLRFVANAAE